MSQTLFSWVKPALPFPSLACQYAQVCMMGARRLRIATWNVNSVRQRLPHLLAYLKEVQPDVVCLQEIKCLTSCFRGGVRGAWLQIAPHGQKTFNGVAILSKRPIEVTRRLPGGDDE